MSVSIWKCFSVQRSYRRVEQAAADSEEHPGIHGQREAECETDVHQNPRIWYRCECACVGPRAHVDVCPLTRSRRSIAMYNPSHGGCGTRLHQNHVTLGSPHVQRLVVTCSHTISSTYEAKDSLKTIHTTNMNRSLRVMEEQ